MSMVTGPFASKPISALADELSAKVAVRWVLSPTFIVICLSVISEVFKDEFARAADTAVIAKAIIIKCFFITNINYVAKLARVLRL